MPSFDEAFAAMQQANMPREAFEELTESEYSALVRMAQSHGIEVVVRSFCPLAHDARHATLAAFVQHELLVAQERIGALETEAAQQAARPVALRKPAPIKVDVAKYGGRENESLPRWLVELDAAIDARGIDEEKFKVAYAMSCLAGRAKTWAFGRRLAENTCFATYSAFKKELRDVFEPPKTEFRARTEFLDMKQGKRDIHAYCNYARYLVSCIVDDPVDASTQVACFLKGLTDGPVKTYLFREYPQTLENAITLALQEDFSLQQAYVHSSTYRPPRSREMSEFDGTEPMDLSAADARGARETRTCHRCGKVGHLQYECTAPRELARARPRADRPGQRRDDRGGRNDRQRRVRFAGIGQAGSRRPVRDER